MFFPKLPERGGDGPARPEGSRHLIHEQACPRAMHSARDEAGSVLGFPSCKGIARCPVLQSPEGRWLHLLRGEIVHVTFPQLNAVYQTASGRASSLAGCFRDRTVSGRKVVGIPFLDLHLNWLGGASWTGDSNHQIRVRALPAGSAQ